MPLTARLTVVNLGNPVSIGADTLVGGTVAVAGITGHSANARIQVSREGLGVGVLGDLSFVFNSAAGTLIITSSAATEVSTVHWYVIG